MIAGVIAVFAVALVLDSQPSSLPQAGRRDAELNASDVALIARRVERLRGLSFRHLVKPQFVSRDRAVEIVEQANRRGYPESKLRADEEMLKLLGLLPPSESLGDTLRTIENEQILGFYDPRTKRLVVVRDERASRALLEITLSHELTHAIEDQNFGLKLDAGRSDDREIARSAMVEGSATELMSIYARRYIPPKEILNLAFADGGDTKLPRYVEDSLVFPYLEGQKFVQTFRGEVVPLAGGSWKPFNSLLRGRGAQSSEQILHPLEFALGDSPKRLLMPDLSRLGGQRWKRVNSGAVGELDLRELFKIVGGSAAPKAAEGWGGGQAELWVYEGTDLDDCRAPCTHEDLAVLRFAWDTALDRVEGERELRKLFRGKRLTGKRLASSASVGLWSSRGGVIGINSGRATTVVFAPNAATAARALRSIGA